MSKKWAIPWPLFVNFRLLKQTLQFLQQIYVKNVHPVLGFEPTASSTCLLPKLFIHVYAQDDEIIVNYNYLYVFFYVNLPSMFASLFPLAFRILVLKILFA